MTYQQATLTPRTRRRRAEVLAGMLVFTAGTMIVPASLAGTDFALIGDEFQVNSYTSAFQGGSDISGQADGSFVVVWESNVQDGDDRGVAMRRFDGTAVPVGPDRVVNGTTEGIQDEPTVATLIGGDVVVVWSQTRFAEPTDVRMRRFAPDLTPLGGEVLVSAPSRLDNRQPAIAAGVDGGFVVAWDHVDPDTVEPDVHLRAYDSEGIPRGEIFQVNTETTGTQRFSTITAQPDGDFIVVWGNRYEDGLRFGVFGRQISADGTPISNEFQVNAQFGVQFPPRRVRSDADGDFIVVWEGFNEVDKDGGVFARRFAEDTSPLGPDVLINTRTESSQVDADLAISPDGSFVVAWVSFDGYFYNGDEDINILAQVFDSEGSRIGSEFRVNSYATGFQGFPSVQATRSGEFVIAWDSDYHDGSSTGVFAQRLVLGPVCGDADGDRDVDAADARIVLIGAISDARCDPCVCDSDPREGVTAGDALRVLRKAVGLTEMLACPSCTSR